MGFVIHSNAYYFAGNIGIGANLIKTTNMAIKEVDGNKISIRNAADTADGILLAGSLWSYGTNYFYGITEIENTYGIQSGGSNNDYITFKARQNDVGFVEVGRLQGAVDPYFKVGSLTALYSGNVGIGNTTPLTALDVVGSASLSANLSFRNSATNLYYLDNSNLNIQRSPKGDASPISVMYLSNNGNVGIGTTAPGVKLEVASSGYAAGAIATWPDYDPDTNSNSFTGLKINAGGNGSITTAGYGPTALVQLASNIFDSRAVIMPTGAGSTSPADQGTGYGKDLMVLGGYSDNSGTRTGGRLFLQGGSGYSGGFGTNYGNVILQSLGGNVGIGTPAPTSKLHVLGTANITAASGASSLYTDPTGNIVIGI